ncbi:MAG: type 4a pilus biogenesis protein PilO, partial [Candidatus Caldatribacteriaceae bacterium]
PHSGWSHVQLRSLPGVEETMSFEKNWSLYLLIWVGVLILLLFFGITPVFQRVDMLSQERDRLKQEILVLQKKVKQLEELETRLESLKTLARTLEERIPNEKEIPNLLLTIEDASFLSRAEILSLTPQGMQSGSDYMELPLQTSLRTSFPEFLLFLNYLRQSPRLVQVKGFNFRREKEGFLVGANLATYLLPPSQEEVKTP